MKGGVERVDDAKGEPLTECAVEQEGQDGGKVEEEEEAAAFPRLNESADTQEREPEKHEGYADRQPKAKGMRQESAEKVRHECEVVWPNVWHQRRA